MLRVFRKQDSVYHINPLFLQAKNDKDRNMPTAQGIIPLPMNRTTPKR